MSTFKGDEVPSDGITCEVTLSKEDFEGIYAGTLSSSQSKFESMFFFWSGFFLRISNMMHVYVIATNRENICLLPC